MNERELLLSIRKKISKGINPINMGHDERDVLFQLITSEVTGARWHAWALRTKLENMSLEERAEHFQFCMEELTALIAKANEDPVYDRLRAMKLSSQEARFASLVLALEGKHLSKEATMTALYWDRPDDTWPEVKILDVISCRARQKMRAHGEPIIPISVWGGGWKAGPA